MKLYVINDYNKEKLFINANAQDRKELANKLGGHLINIDGNTYNIKDVKAEKGEDNTSINMVVGGVIGALGGGFGVAAGGIIGALVGKAKDKAEEEKVAQFNESNSW